MSIFTDTMVEAIRKYRTMLRKYLPQSERINQLHKLNLKNPQLYNSEVALYHLGYKMIDHLQQLDETKNGYYSYSGISQFAGYLKKFLEKYKIDQDYDRVIHTSQLASRYILKTTQLLAAEPISEEALQEIFQCNEMIALNGSTEQVDLYQNSLQNMLRKHLHDHNGYLRSTLDHFPWVILGAKRQQCGQMLKVLSRAATLFLVYTKQGIVNVGKKPSLPARSNPEDCHGSLLVSP